MFDETADTPITDLGGEKRFESSKITSGADGIGSNKPTAEQPVFNPPLSPAEKTGAGSLESPVTSKVNLPPMEERPVTTETNLMEQLDQNVKNTVANPSEEKTKPPFPYPTVPSPEEAGEDTSNWLAQKVSAQEPKDEAQNIGTLQDPFADIPKVEPVAQAAIPLTGAEHQVANPTAASKPSTQGRVAGFFNRLFGR